MFRPCCSMSCRWSCGPKFDKFLSAKLQLSAHLVRVSQDVGFGLAGGAPGVDCERQLAQHSSDLPGGAAVTSRLLSGARHVEAAIALCCACVILKNTEMYRQLIWISSSISSVMLL